MGGAINKLAVVQLPPALLDREKTIARAVSAIDEAVAEGAQMVVFTEVYVTGYPTWIWRLRPGTDWGLNETLHARLSDQSVNIERGDLAPLCEAARRHGVAVLCGITERDSEQSRTTLYNSYVAIGPDGQLRNRHRKLMPTKPERMVWGFGDGSELNVIDTPCGRMGALIFWQNLMPLARYSLYAQGLEVYTARTYDSGDDWIESLRHISREAGCWVVGSENQCAAATCVSMSRGCSSSIPMRMNG